MARFVFELEAVLGQRRRAERDQRVVVAGLERERRAIEAEIRGYQRSIEQERDDLAGLLGAERGARGAVDLRGARVQASASLHLVAKAQRAVIRLSGVHRRIDESRLRLLELAVSRQAMESLRDKRLAEWRRAESKAEDAAIDELAVMRHGRGDGAVEPGSPGPGPFGVNAA